MKAREVRVSYGLTVNAGNYNSERIDVGYTAEVEEGQTPDAVAAQLIRMARHRTVSDLAESPNPNVRRFAQDMLQDPGERPF